MQYIRTYVYLHTDATLQALRSLQPCFYIYSAIILSKLVFRIL